ncbi:rhamnogalacturonan acetylesterase [Alteromonas gilva]|uniref:Rhamnogalacturonan acetylesterase n=1 Tax=Alteromonas gilva TaxID=2987522 RepID=A0ABT5KXE7_9ALTE|nr:rhamnogalacturonan acetylesterase [Alteromonas gilva]MDC8829440.1 rhamnogalacturonan acetylesterase [Alteromonas gilva]
MKKLLLLCLALTMTSMSAGSLAWDPTRVALHLVGDSTMSNKPNLAYPERGWGQLLPEYFSNELEIVNHAANGRSTRRFIDEGRWALVLSELKAGDYVLIQFGHNDQKVEDPTRYASAEKDYPAFLRRYIAEVRAKDATPMIASSICRRHFDEQGNLQRKLLDYAAAAREVARDEEVEFFDLNEQTCGFLKDIGEPASRQYFIQVPPDLYTRYPEGKTDNTHLNVVGASKVAQFFIRDLRKRNHPLANYVYRDSL